MCSGSECHTRYQDDAACLQFISVRFFSSRRSALLKWSEKWRPLDSKVWFCGIHLSVSFVWKRFIQMEEPLWYKAFSEESMFFVCSFHYVFCFHYVADTLNPRTFRHLVLSFLVLIRIRKATFCGPVFFWNIKFSRLLQLLDSRPPPVCNFFMGWQVIFA